MAMKNIENKTEIIIKEKGEDLFKNKNIKNSSTVSRFDFYLTHI